MNDKEVIEKLADAYRRVRKIGPDAIYETELREVLRAAADALEARQPRVAVSEDDQEALAKLLFVLDAEGNEEFAAQAWGNHPNSHAVKEYFFRRADGILAAGFSRAAVPDAAIRELTEAIRLTVEYTGNDMLPAIDGWDWYDALVKYAPEVAQAFVDKPIHFPKQTGGEAEQTGGELAACLELRAYWRSEAIEALAERAAALAAIERVRAIHYPVPAADVLPDKQLCANEACEGFYPCDTIAALDGAPEPEWEYTASKHDPGPHHLTVFSKAPETLASRNEGRIRLGHEPLPIWRRRKAGPWLPVEGESKP